VRHRFGSGPRSKLALTVTLLAVVAPVMLSCSSRSVVPDTPAPPHGREATAGVAVGRDETEVQGLLSSLASPATTATVHDREIRLLAASDPKRLVHSVAAQIPGAKDHPRALAEFDSVYDTRGGRAAFDALIAAAAAPLKPSTAGRDGDLRWLSPSVLAVGDMFRSRDMLFGSLPLKRIRVVGATAELTYGRPSGDPVVLLLDMERDASGGLRMVGLRGLRPGMLQLQEPHP